MPIDPVCKMEISIADAAASHDYHAETLYFCSIECLREFERDPAGEGAAQEIGHTADRLIDPERLRLQDLPAAGRQQLRGPRDAALMQQGIQNPQLAQIQFW